MFGYLKLDPYASEELKRYYKYKYCLLCKKVATELIDYSSVILYKYNKVYEVEEEEIRCY